VGKQGALTITCNCCQLPQKVPDRNGAIPVTCDLCTEHRGQSQESQLLRALVHEAMLRERLVKCRKAYDRFQVVLESEQEKTAKAREARLRHWLAGAILRRISLRRLTRRTTMNALRRDSLGASGWNGWLTSTVATLRIDTETLLAARPLRCELPAVRSPGCCCAGRA
jgi:hypothetical protein